MSRLMSVSLLLAAAVLLVAAALGGYHGGHAQGLQALREDSNHRLDLFAATAQGRISRLEHSAAAIQLHPAVLALYRGPVQARPAERVAAANDLLRRLNAYQGSTAVFVADERGMVLASSNQNQPDDSQLGQDLSYRPYYTEALSGRVGRHFAVGTAADAPGYFFSHPIRDGDRVVGVAVTKVSLADIDQAFPLLGTPAVIIDRNAVVILSSRPQWRYAAMQPLTVEARVDLDLTGMYGNRRIGDFPLPLPLDWQADTQTLDQVLQPDGEGAGLLVQGRTLDGMDWRLLMFSDLAGVRQRALVTAAMTALCAAFVMLALLALLQRQRAARQRLNNQQALQRLNAELEETVARRTRALTDTNLELRREMAERVQAEATLRAAQDDLVQAAKLAVVGQLSAGITHELAQPLGAIRTLAGNAREFMRRGDLDGAHGNLAIVDTLVERMGGIIHPFKAFARKSPVEPTAVPVAAALRSALFLLDQRLRAEQVSVHLQLQATGAEDAGDAAGPSAWCNRNRLEQVLVNLIGNAIDAMHGSPSRQLHIEAGEQEAGRVFIRIADSGSGLPPPVLAGLFTPFFTTKPPGSGLGLGLVISRGIARDYGGELTAANRPEGGAVFSLCLPAVPRLPLP